MVAGKLLTTPIRPSEGVFSTLLVGNGSGRGWAESWAESEPRKMTNRKIGPGKRFKIPPEKSEELVAPVHVKEKPGDSADEIWRPVGAPDSSPALQCRVDDKEKIKSRRDDRNGEINFNRPYGTEYPAIFTQR
jgi:hypothetical protein